MNTDVRLLCLAFSTDIYPFLSIRNVELKNEQDMLTYPK